LQVYKSNSITPKYRKKHGIVSPPKLAYKCKTLNFLLLKGKGRAMKRYHTSGFTLMELMIVIAIIGILVAIAIPSYKNYTRRAHYSEIVQAASPYKVGIEECFQMLGGLNNCQAGQNGIPPMIAHGKGSGLIDELSVSSGIIKIIPQEKYGILSVDTYELIPKIENDILVWSSGGGGVTKGYAN
jgi:type IV pilus assembly protein PilA